MQEDMRRSFDTTLDIPHDEDVPPITQRATGLERQRPRQR
jgi:hypothetical protein